MSRGRLFQTFTTRSQKNVDRARMLLCFIQLVLVSCSLRSKAKFEKFITAYIHMTK